ncbi:MAG TPA: hypothetical protein VNY82_07220 [Steroidobacteraceae bacterium]|nr:hypothetical protein [Steroidobacteraceae bacterium]
MSQTEPNDPPPQEEPIQDVPVYPEQDPPPGTETTIRVSAGPGEHDVPDEGDDDVDEGATHASHGHPRGGGAPDCERANACVTDLDPQAPHSPPDVGRGRVIFDENDVAG